jgi:hypothetical protein
LLAQGGAKGEIALHHESAINKFLSDNDLQALAPKEFPCTPELYKRIMLEPVPSTDEEKKVNANQVCVLEVSRMGSAYSKDDGAVGDHTACTVAAQFMANPSKLHFALVMQIIAHLKWVVVSRAQDVEGDQATERVGHQ